ncbi:DDE Tnp 1 7 domain containing protein [Asbolus verrucosus]|uniref:DDE Tnp 1 7 domain containing protein n=1 Tax=Asbolus verrucosus TaxID=1661398 RepID=A0A482VG31_ASBVE|nr:DDE Tnp 1 7 domain containing protein [Asbolus verrucosus]
MSGKRFEILINFLRFDDCTTRSERKKCDRAAAISEFFYSFIHNSQEMYYPSENVTVDEMLDPFRGRINRKSSVTTIGQKVELTF